MSEKAPRSKPPPIPPKPAVKPKPPATPRPLNIPPSKMPKEITSDLNSTEDVSSRIDQTDAFLKLSSGVDVIVKCENTVVEESSPGSPSDPKPPPRKHRQKNPEINVVHRRDISADVTLRDSEKRTSKPTRGTIAAAMGSLFSKGQTEENPCISVGRKPVPQKRLSLQKSQNSEGISSPESSSETSANPSEDDQDSFKTVKEQSIESGLLEALSPDGDENNSKEERSPPEKHHQSPCADESGLEGSHNEEDQQGQTHTLKKTSMLKGESSAEQDISKQDVGMGEAPCDESVQIHDSSTDKQKKLECTAKTSDETLLNNAQLVPSSDAPIPPRRLSRAESDSSPRLKQTSKVVRRPSDPPPQPPSLLQSSSSVARRTSKPGPKRPPPPISMPSHIAPPVPSSPSLQCQEILTEEKEDPTVESVPTVNVEQPTPESSVDEGEIYLTPKSTIGGYNRKEESFPERHLSARSSDPYSDIGDTDTDDEYHMAKSGRIKSYGSNIYEDLVSTSSDDDDVAVSSTRDRDMFSTDLDETFENEEEADSSAESDAGKTDAEKEAQKRAKQKEKAYKVVQEIMTTEEEFLDKLKLLNIDFRNFITKATEERGEAIIPATSMNKILQNLPQLSEINTNLLEDIKNRVEKWDTNPTIADIFVKKGAFLKMYITYIKNFEPMTAALEDAVKTYPLFAERLKEFESSERCQNLKISNYMLKPVQRIPQYKLLLQEYRKSIPADSSEMEEVEEALKIVTEVANCTNEAMREDETVQVLLRIQDSLVGDSRFKVFAPSRSLVKQGLVEKQSRKENQLRMLFLFNDVLLITKPQQGAKFEVRNTISVEKMEVKKSSQEDFQKEFIIVSEKKSFAALAIHLNERNEWVNALEDTINKYQRQMATRLRGVTNTTSKDYVLGEVAPVWIPDAKVTMCQLCSTHFTTINRRHHCRACGKVLCGACSSYKAPLKFKEYKAERVCSACYKKLLDDLSTDESIEAGENSEARIRHMEIRSRFKDKGAKEKDSRQRKKTKTVLQEVQANDLGDLSGYLEVQDKKKHWKKYWFVIKNNVLYKYNASEDPQAIESKPLPGYKVAQVGSNSTSLDGMIFRLSHPTSDKIEPVIFRTAKQSSAKRWIAKLTESTMLH